MNPVNPFSIDMFEDEYSGGAKLHLRVQKRNARKCITTVSGLPKTYTCSEIKKMLSFLKKKLSCSGIIVDDDNELIVSDKQEWVLQFSGDQRVQLQDFFIADGIAEPHDIIVHGY